VEPLKPNDPSELGDWSITGRLGEGEDSVIYLGVRGVAGSEQAAIKLIEDDSFEFESALEKIKNEVDALKQLNNENIVKLLDANYEQGNLWIATEYIHGVTLDTKLKQTRAPLEELTWFRIAENIFHALEAAHAKGIIHKDIKPSNIILSESGAKLIDFGISHVPQRTRVANPGDFEGSRLFSAPENYNRKNIEEMDVFSAGVTLAYAAKLKSVWAGDNQDAITESIKNDNPDLSGITPLQEEFIRPLLQKLPIDRPNSANVHKKALEYIEYLVDKEHKNKPVALRVKKTLSRRLGNPWIKWGVPVGLVSAMAVAVSSPWSSQQNLTTAVDSESLISSPNSSSTEEYPSPGPIVSYSPPSAYSELQSKIVKSEEAYSVGDFETSLKFSLSAAEEGNARAMNIVGLNYEKLKKTSLAIEWYKRSVKLGYGNAFSNLGALLISLKQYKEGVTILKAGVTQNHPGSMNVLALYYNDSGDKEQSKQLFLQAAQLGHSMSMFNYALLLEQEGKKSSALQWYLRSVDAGYTESLNAVGFLYEQEADWVNARKYYEKSAQANDPYGIYNLAIVLGNYFSDNSSRPCDLLNQVLGIKEVDPELLKNVRDAMKKGCLSKPSPSATPGKPVAASESFKISDPVATNVQVDEIFGRPFEDGLQFWQISLTNSKGEKVPEITSVQFRMLGYPNAGWMNVPYILKTSTTTGNVYASVDDILFSLVFKETKYCPEFRMVREEKGEIVHIWNKGLPDCATDYNP
jgi:serine/threonine protein kinase